MKTSVPIKDWRNLFHQVNVLSHHMGQFGLHEKWPAASISFYFSIHMNNMYEDTLNNIQSVYKQNICITAKSTYVNYCICSS